MTSAYCDTADLYSYGLPRGGLANPGRLIASISAGADTFALDGHGLSTGDPVAFRAESGGTLPDPIVEATTYYAIAVSDDTFSVSVAVDGAAINLTTAGTYVLAIVPLPIARAIGWASTQIDDMLPAHLVPLEAPYPPTVVMTAAELAAGKLGYFTGLESRSLSAVFDAAQKRLARWAKGVPLRGVNTPTASNLAASSAGAARLDRRGWSNCDGTIP